MSLIRFIGRPTGLPLKDGVGRNLNGYYFKREIPRLSADKGRNKLGNDD